MLCHSCGAEVREGQRFCMDCGASLRGVADITGEVPVVRTATDEAPDEHAEETSRELAVVPPAPARDVTSPIPTLPPPPPPSTTTELVVVEATAPVATHTGSLPALVTTGTISTTPPPTATATTPATGRGFRLRPLLLVALAAAAATALAVFTDVVRITPPPDGAVPQYTVNGLGTNNTIAALLAAGGAVVGALVWCTRRRWGAGLAGGAGASLAGWAALLIGLTEWRISAAPGAEVEREVGFYGLWATGGLGVLLLVMSLARAGRERRSGLDPWIAALAAVSFVIAAAGPLIPQGTADWSGNWSDASLGGVQLPDAFFIGRLVQLGLLVLCGVVGCLLVRRWGLGLAVGGLLSCGWLLVTAATDRTPSPIGPAYANPGAGRDLSPHAVTVVGFALAAFFSLVAVVLALLDGER